MTHSRPGRSGHLTVMIVMAVLMLAIGGLVVCAAAAEHGSAGSADANFKFLKVFGKVTNPHETGVGDVDLEVTYNGKALEPIDKGGHGHGEGGVRTEADGTYQAVFKVPASTLPGAEIEISAFKPSYARATFKVEAGHISTSEGGMVVNADFKIKRTKGPAFWIATVVFILAYVLISFELLHRTLAAARRCHNAGDKLYHWYIQP